MTTPQEHSHLGKRGSAALWFAVLGAATVWFLAQLIGYLFVPWACSHATTWPLHLITLPALAVSVFSGFTAYRLWKAEGERWSEDVPAREDRSRFLFELGMGSSALFSLLLLGHWISILILDPCIPRPRVPFTPDALLGGGQLLFAHVGAPLQPHDFWSAWSTDPGIWLTLLWGGVFYGAGLQHAPQRIRRHAFAFAAACLALAVALLSPLHALSEVLFSAHMAQHTLLIAVAAPLLVLGRPVLISLWGLPPHWRKTVTRHAVSRTLMQLTQMRPMHAFALHGITLWIWHLPVLYQASLISDPVHVLQHLTFLVTAVLFWASVFDVRHRRTSYGVGVLYTFATAVHTSILGALMTVAPLSWYPRYAATTEVWGLTPLEDQQLAGLIMWVPAGLLYTIVALVLLAKWLQAAELNTRARMRAAAPVLCLAAIIAACDWPPGVTHKALNSSTAASITGGEPSEGKRLIERYGCGGCHTIAGVRGANGLVGPPLNGIGRRMYVAGVITNTPQNMARWIHDPQAVDSLTVMPRLGVTLHEARDITAYLYTLQ